MKVYFGADHRGYKLKEELQNWLKELKYAVKDMGAYEFNEKDDYTLYAEKVGSIVGKEKGSRGILLCGSGVGVDIVANKFDGVRASIGKSKEQIKAGRNDDDMNILVIAADYTSKEEAKGMLKVFLETKFSQKEKFKKRLEDIKRIEANN
jgi:ribose 5-phosphate isomerase B